MCYIYISKQTNKTKAMTNIDTATRSELEVVILENDLEYMFGTLNEIINTDTEIIREKIRKWVIAGDETK